MVKFKFKIVIAILVLFLLFARSGLALNSEEECFRIAVESFSDGFYASSISLFERFIQEFPQSQKLPQIKLYIAKAYYFRGELLPTLQALKEIIDEKVAPGVIDEACYWFAKIELKEKNFEDANFYAKQVIKKYPASKFYAPAHYLAAKSCIGLSKEKEAQGHFKKVIEECEMQEMVDEAYSYLLDSYLQKEKYLLIFPLGQAYLKKYPQGELLAKVHFSLGKSYSAEGRSFCAIANYESALELNKDKDFADFIRKELALSLLLKGELLCAKENIDKITNEEMQLFLEGLYCFKTNDYPKAQMEFDTLLKKFPESNFCAKAHLNKAEMFYETGRLNDALYLYEYILQNFKSPQDKAVLDKAHYGLGWCYLKKGEFKKAIEEFKHTLKYSNNPIVKLSSQIQIADANHSAADYSEALKIYQHVLENTPRTVYADYVQFQIGRVFMKTRQFKKALSAFTNLERDFPSSTLLTQARYYCALGHFSLGQYQTAQKLLENFMQKYPQNSLASKANYFYGRCLFNQGKWKSALETFEMIARNCEDKEVKELSCIDLGNTYLKLSLPQKARETWDSFLNNFPQSRLRPCVILHLGRLSEQEKEFSRAYEYYNQVIQDFSDSIWAKEALLSLGHLYLKKNQKELAYEYFAQLSKTDSPFAEEAKLYLARICVQKKENLKALKFYDELLKGDSAISGSALIESAYLLKDMKEYFSAADLFKKLIAQGRNSPKNRFYLGLCLEKANQNKEAIEEYFKVVLANDEEYKVKSYFRIAKLYEKDKNLEGAKEIYRKLIEFNVKETKIARARLKELEKE